MEGWTCPKCGVCYNPNVRSCSCHRHGPGSWVPYVSPQPWYPPTTPPTITCGGTLDSYPVTGSAVQYTP